MTTTRTTSIDRIRLRAVADGGHLGRLAHEVSRRLAGSEPDPALVAAVVCVLVSELGDEVMGQSPEAKERVLAATAELLRPGPPGPSPKDSA